MSIVAGLLNQSVDKIYSVTVSGSGDTTRTELYSLVPCRWQKTVKQFFKNNSEPVITTIQMWVDSTYTIVKDYEVLKGSDLYRVIEVEERYDLSGNKDHTKVYLS